MKKTMIFMMMFMIVGCSNADEQSTPKNQVKLGSDETAVQKIEQLKQEASTEASQKASQAAVEKTVSEQADTLTKAGMEEAKQAVEQKANETAQALEKKVENAVAPNKEVPPEKTEYKAGIHYSIIEPAWDTGNKDKVVVYEFFGYLCPHCYTFQTYMHAFEQRKQDNVEVVRVPMVFQPMWKMYAQAFYTAESMGILEKTHLPFFKALHEEQKQFRSIEQIAEWYQKNFGVDKDQFLSTAKSFMIDGMIRKSDQMMRQMRITSTPTVVVDGKFKPNVKQIHNRDDLMKLVDYLVQQQSTNSNQ